MTMTTGDDAPHTVSDEDLSVLRRAMHSAEPNWPVMAGELARHLELLGPLVAGTVRGIAAEHALFAYRQELDTWHTLADRYYAAFDKTISHEPVTNVPPTS